MRPLAVTPIIAPPRAGVAASYDSPDHLLIFNDAVEWPLHAAVETFSPPAPMTCPQAWNYAARFASDHGYDALTILSQGLRLDDGVTGLLDRLGACGPSIVLTTEHHPFHCVTWPLDVWAELGAADESLPITADIDLFRRAFLAGLSLEYLGVSGETVRNTALNAGKVRHVEYALCLLRYERKWGGRWAAETVGGPPTVLF